MLKGQGQTFVLHQKCLWIPLFDSYWTVYIGCPWMIPFDFQVNWLSGCSRLRLNLWSWSQWIDCLLSIQYLVTSWPLDSYLIGNSGFQLNADDPYWFQVMWLKVTNKVMFLVLNVIYARMGLYNCFTCSVCLCVSSWGGGLHANGCILYMYMHLPVVCVWTNQLKFKREWHVTNIQGGFK